MFSAYDGLVVNGLTVMLPGVPEAEAADLAGEVREMPEKLFESRGEDSSPWSEAVLVVHDERYPMPSAEELEGFGTVFVYERGNAGEERE